jgi:hypothetical protein
LDRDDAELLEFFKRFPYRATAGLETGHEVAFGRQTLPGAILATQDLVAEDIRDFLRSGWD